MYCPNCAAEAKTDQKFCRSCGMEMQGVAALIGAQNIANPDCAKVPFRQGRQRAMLVWGMILTLAAVFFGSSLKLLGKEHIQVAGQFTPYLMVITLLIAFLGMGLMCYPFLQMMMAPNRRPSLPVLPKSEPTSGLNRPLLREEPSSIVEKTTEFLEGTPLLSDIRDTAPHAE